MSQRHPIGKRAFILVFALVAASCTRTSSVEVTRTQTITSEVEQSTGGDVIRDGDLSDGGTSPAGGGGATTGNVAGTSQSSPGGHSSSGNQSSADTDAPAREPIAATPDATPTEGPIKIGVMSTLSGGNKFVGEPPYRIALAYAERLNAHGGINGRELEILGYDVCLNCPDEGKAQAIKAVEKDKVFALANTFVVNASLDQVIPYLNEKRVPMIQGSSGEQSRKPELSPYNFSVGLTVPARAAIGADHALQYLEENNLPKKVALLYFNDSLGKFVSENQRAAIERLGIEIVDEEPVTYDATMTNQNSQVVKMQLAGAEMVIGAHGVLCAFSMQAAEQNGWHVPYVCTIAYDGFMATYAGEQALTDRDVFADTEGYATPDMDSPGMLDYLSLLDEYYPTADKGLVTLYSYMGMRLLEDGLRSMGNNVTRDGLVQWMERIDGYTANGLTPPFRLGPDDHGSINGAHVVQLEPDGTFTRLTDDWIYPAPVHGLPGPIG